MVAAGASGSLAAPSIPGAERMTRHLADPSRLRRLAALAPFLAAAALVALLGVWRDNAGKLRGDEATFAAMTASLVRDHDLRFDARDEAWALSRPERPPGLILQRTPSGVSYSKPILYPLLASPFEVLFGERGLLVFNVAAVAAALALAAAALRRREAGDRALDSVLLFAGASIVLPYLAWKMTESLQVALATAGLALALGGDLGGAGARAPVARWLDGAPARLAGAALLGLLVALREPNVAVAAVPVLAALAARRPGRALAAAVASAAAYGVVALATVALSGTASPYKSIRSTFDATTGYPIEARATTPTSPAKRFDVQRNLATSDLGLVPVLTPRRSAYAAFYFFFGRHAGLLAYFPAALALLWAASRGCDRAGRAALAGFALAAGFYLVWWPENFFGGETCIGNRYLLAAYPCLLFAPRRLPSRRAIAVAWLVAAAFGLSAALSVARTAKLDPSSQNHAYAGLFRWLPYESVASTIDGRRDRYWSGDFLRFVDPFARVDRGSFFVDSGTPPAEVELATGWAGRPLQFLVHADAPRATLMVGDWLDSDRVPLTPLPGGTSGGLAIVHPSPAWRWHSFWFRMPGAPRARLLRIALETPDGSPASAEVRYLGERGIPADGFGREVLSAELPASAPAGGQTRVPLALRHRGGWSWDSDAPLAVYLAVRFEALDGGAASEARVRLPHPVAPGGRLDMELPIHWPAAPGRYRVVVDLVLEGVAWFAERVGAPVVAGEVTVTPAMATPPAPSRR